MYHKLLSLLVLPLFSTSIYATDINNTEAILTQASEATQPIQAKFNSILEENGTQETVIVEKKIIKEPISETVIQNQSIQEAPILQESITENHSDENRTNPEITPDVEEQNNTVVTTAKSNQTIQEENNTTTVEEPLMPTRSTQENNETECTTTLNITDGNSEQGKKIFIKNFKQQCDTTAYKFAENYAQEEWEEIAESGKFQETIFKLCPNITESYKERWSSHLYQFFYEHANDTENIPEC